MPWLYSGPRKGYPYLQRCYRHYYSCDAELLFEPGSHGYEAVRILILIYKAMLIDFGS